MEMLPSGRCALHRHFHGRRGPDWRAIHREPGLLHVGYCARGRLNYRFREGGSDRSQALSGGEFLMATPGLFHSATVEGREAEFLTMRVSLSENGRVLQAWPGCTPAVLVGEDPGGAIRTAMLAVFRGKNEAPLVDAGLRFIIALCLSQAARPSGRGDARLEKLRELLDRETDRRLSLPMLAATCGLSPRYLVRAFHRRHGITPARYHLLARLDEARRLLEETALPVVSVAEKTGFPDAATFTKAFRRRFASPPGAWRRDLRDGSVETP